MITKNTNLCQTSWLESKTFFINLRNDFSPHFDQSIVFFSTFIIIIFHLSSRDCSALNNKPCLPENDIHNKKAYIGMNMMVTWMGFQHLNCVVELLIYWKFSLQYT